MESFTTFRPGDISCNWINFSCSTAFILFIIRFWWGQL